MLIVEDVEQCAEMLCAFMRMRGWQPLAVATLGEAIGAIKARPFDVTLLDLSLPDSDATRTIERIGELRTLGAGRVIVVTGAEVTDMLKEMSISSGAAGVLNKNEFIWGRTVDDVVGKPA